MHGFNVLVIKLVLLCGRHVSSGRSTGLIQNISNIKVKCLVEFLANLAKYCRNLRSAPKRELRGWRGL